MAATDAPVRVRFMSCRMTAAGRIHLVSRCRLCACVCVCVCVCEREREREREREDAEDGTGRSVRHRLQALMALKAMEDRGAHREMRVNSLLMSGAAAKVDRKEVKKANLC